MKKVIGIITAGVMALGIGTASAQSFDTLTRIEALAEKFVANEFCPSYEIDETEFKVAMFDILESAPTLNLPDAADLVIMMGTKIQQNLGRGGQSSVNAFCKRFTAI